MNKFNQLRNVYVQKFVTKTSPDRNGSDRNGQTQKSCSVSFCWRCFSRL